MRPSPASDGALALAEGGKAARDGKRTALNALWATDLKGGASQQWQNWPLNSAGKPIPEMPDEPRRLPDTDLFGASGTAIFSGIITTDEYNPDLISPIDRSNVYDQMRRNHAPVKALLKLIAQPILRADWKIEKGSDDDASEEIASFVDTALFHEMAYEADEGSTVRQTWDEILRHILLMYAFGFVGFELGYRIQDGWTMWSKWTPLLPRTIWRWWVGADNELAGIQQWTFKSWSYQFINIPAWKLLLFAYDQEGNNYEGISVLRAAYKHWMYAQNIEKIDAIAIERQAVMPPVITIPENYTGKDMTAAQTIAQNIRANENMGVTIPNTWGIEMLRSRGHQQTQTLPTIQYHNSMILEAAMAGWVGLGQGPGATGTYALADILVKVFEQTLQADMKLIEQRVNGAIRRLVDYNFEDVEVYPTLKAGKVSLTDVAGMAQGIQQLVQAQVIHPTPELEEAILDGLGLPKGQAQGSEITETNPTDPNTPPQPENPDTAGIADQESEETPPSAAASGATPQAGGGQQLSESVLLGEVMAAIRGGDVVDRGLTFMGGHQPGYTQNRGPGGKWGPGNGPSEGEGSGGGPRGAGGAARSGSGGGGRGRGGTAGGKSSGGARASRAPKSEEEKAAAKQQRATAAKAKAETAARAKGQAEASGTAEPRSGAGAGKGKAEKPPTYEQWKQGYEGIRAQIEARNLAGDFRGAASGMGSQISWAGAYPRHFARYEREQAAGKAEAAAAPKESIHERAARLQQEQGLPHELQLKNGRSPDNIVPIAHAGEVHISRDLDPGSAENAHTLLQLYGGHQLGAVLHGYTPGTIKEMAQSLGIKAGGSKAETISRITAHLTGGRYSANFPKATAARGGASKATKGEATTRASVPKATTTTRTSRQELHPVISANQLRIGRDAGNSAYALRHLYGQSQLRAALDGYTLKTLKGEMLPEVQGRHPGTRPASLTSKGAIADYITERIGSEGENLPMSGDGWQMNG